MSEPLPGTAGEATAQHAAWEPPSLDEMQQKLPQYEFVKVLGKGGMGVVYQARQITLDRFVALKVLPPGVEDDEVDFRQRFITEARSMARLSHPNIVHVHDFGATSDGLLYFVMEFVEGTNLEDVLAKKGCIPPKLTVHLMGQICDALGYAHEHKLIHRDVKPSNILVDNDGRIRVADFGLAQDDHGTAAAVNMGTPEYAAPELTREGAPLDHRVDLYALGVMLYQMLTGEVPKGEFLPASKMKPDVDPRFDNVILKAISWDVDARYASAAAIKNDLEATLAPPEPEGDKAKKKELPPFQAAPSKKRGISGLVAVVPVIIAMGLVALAVSVIQKKRGDDTGPEPERKAPPVFGAAPVKPLPEAPVAAKEEPKEPEKPVAKPVAKAEPTAKRAPAPSPEVPAKPQPKPEPTPADPKMAKATTGEKPPDEFWKPPPGKSPSMSGTPNEAVSPPAKPASAKSDLTKPPPIVMADVSDLVKKRLAEMNAEFESQREALLDRDYYPKMETLKSQYAAALKRTRDAAQAGNDTALTEAVEAELQLVADNRAIPERDEANTPPELVELRTTYRTHRNANRNALPSLLLPVYDAHLEKLSQLQAELLQVNRATDARFVELTVEDIRSARGSLE